MRIQSQVAKNMTVIFLVKIAYLKTIIEQWQKYINNWIL